MTYKCKDVCLQLDDSCNGPKDKDVRNVPRFYCSICEYYLPQSSNNVGLNGKHCICCGCPLRRFARVKRLRQRMRERLNQMYVRI